jgi:hypothetical protein
MGDVRERGEESIEIHGDLTATTGKTRVWSFCPMLWQAESPQLSGSESSFTFLQSQCTIHIRQVYKGVLLCERGACDACN